ncbi:hypothetical protein [Accumulibacter sp.]|uniref:hypothetical protein n=1 Tax=Accumulibacter sp. TaxID=2053492 RepID=UPI002621BA7A|nr:hypothetical protein [Accumulibacter sp.]
MRFVWVLALAALSAACGTINWDVASRAERSVADESYTQSPNPTVRLEPAKAVALAGAVGYAANHYVGPAANLQMSAAAAIVAYVIYDPLSPNWTIEEKALNGDTYLLSMRAKSFRIGGDGESGLIIRRRALQLQRERGFAGYRIVNYSEGVESSTPFTHRYAEGTIQLVRADPGKPLP